MSRYPITKQTAGQLGAIIALGEKRVAVLNIHLTDYPYQPYQLLGIPYGAAPMLDEAASAIAAARKARGPGMDLLEQELGEIAGADVALVTGDMNEPSHRDWTTRAAAAGVHPMAVAFPTARRIESLGFRDAWREVYPDELARPGFTWTPITSPSDPADHHDRIDYLFVRGQVVVEAVSVVGEKHPEADIVVTPWPSDHRAVLGRFRFD